MFIECNKQIIYVLFYVLTKLSKIMNELCKVYSLFLD